MNRKPSLIHKARELRKNATPAERLLWRHLRNRQLSGHKFRRQTPIGHYIVDFVCLENKLIVEIDGGQHNQEVTIIKDISRQQWLKGEGFRVLRFWNHEVIGNLQGVLEQIEVECKRWSPSPQPSPSRERKPEKFPILPRRK